MLPDGSQGSVGIITIAGVNVFEENGILKLHIGFYPENINPAIYGPLFNSPDTPSRAAVKDDTFADWRREKFSQNLIEIIAGLIEFNDVRSERWNLYRQQKGLARDTFSSDIEQLRSPTSVLQVI